MASQTDFPGTPNPNPSSTERALPVLPLPNGVVLPHMVVTVALESDEAQAAADAAAAHGAGVVLLPRIEGRFAKVGVFASVENAGELPNGQRAVVFRAQRRVALGAAIPGPVGPAGVLWLQVHDADEHNRSGTDLGELATQYRLTVEAYLERQEGGRVALQLSDIDDPSTLADTIAYWPELSLERRVEALETLDVAERLTLITTWVREAIAESELRDKIRTEVTEGMAKQQREFILRQQLAAIRKELGEGADGEGAVEQYRTKAATADLPDKVRAKVDAEIDKLERLGEQNPEHGWVRNWLDTVLAISWSSRTEDQLDLTLARSVLDADTTGLDDAKERIVEWLAVRKRRAALKAQKAPKAQDGSDETAASPAADDTGASDGGAGAGAVPDRSGADADGAADPAGAPRVIEPRGELIGTRPDAGRSTRRGDGTSIVLVGPPGVGKTSLGESVARAMGRRFVRVALGGVRDEAEIRGHRRTYVGAKAGRIAEAVREAGSMNPVILLDEIDKLASGWAGDPGAALLEVLDPAQNHTFRDHYLEIDLDLSEVIFLVTANTLDTIPGPLLDRMEVITVDGYTDREKIAIARNHLLARQGTLHGLEPGDVEVSDDVLSALIEGYTREAGVRNFERQIAGLLRKVVRKLDDDGVAHPYRVDTSEELTALIGRPKRLAEEVHERSSNPGVATGLAVTGAGGDVLFVESTSMPAAGAAEIAVTGQLGDVMKESASIAMSFVRANAEALGIAEDAFEGRRFHVHFPAGAVPKDGPSAGITMTTALVSLLTNRPVRPEVAMTGEVTLAGRVLPIGGVKQKLLAAHRAGITTVIIPKRNEPDLDDVPEEVRAGLTIHAVADVRDVLALALAA